MVWCVWGACLMWILKSREKNTRLPYNTAAYLHRQHGVVIKEKWAASWQNQQYNCAPSEGSDQPWHSPRVFAVHTIGSSGPKLSCGQRRLWSDWVDAQADLRLHWTQVPFCWFCHEAAQMSSNVKVSNEMGIVTVSNMLRIRTQDLLVKNPML